MKTFIPNQDAIIEEQLRDEDHKRDLKWVRDLLNKAEKKGGFDKIDIDRAIDLIKALY